MRWQKIFVIITVFTIFLFLSRGSLSLSKALTNLGMVHLVQLGANVEFGKISRDLTLSQQIFTLSQQRNPRNVTGSRGLAMIYWQQGEDIKAQEKWRAVDFSANEFLAFARYSHFLNSQTSLPWYYLLERLEPDDPRLWLDVGLICQQQPEKDEICQRFLEFNDHNWLVDPEIIFDRAAWRFNRKPIVIYEIESCPDMEDKLCLNLEVPDPAPEGGTSWQQCMYVEAGATYRFSTWLKINTEYDGTWRPLYFQGDVNGRPSGHWPSTEAGSTDWQLREYTFTMPTFDNSRACFHPVHMQSSGNAWFYNPSLKVEQNQTNQ